MTGLQNGSPPIRVKYQFLRDELNFTIRQYRDTLSRAFRRSPCCGATSVKNVERELIADSYAPANASRACPTYSLLPSSKKRKRKKGSVNIS